MPTILTPRPGVKSDPFEEAGRRLSREIARAEHAGADRATIDRLLRQRMTLARLRMFWHERHAAHLG